MVDFKYPLITNTKLFEFDLKETNGIHIFFIRFKTSVGETLQVKVLQKIKCNNLSRLIIFFRLFAMMVR